MTQISFPYEKPLFSGHETFPLRQLWLLKAFSAVQNAINSKAPKSIFSDDGAIELFGVGKNMVSSIKHWALACDVIREAADKDCFEIGDVGELLFGKKACDPYLESDATLWLVHWLLAGRANRSATWYVVFNFVINQSFRPNEVIELISEYAIEKGLARSQTTLKRDLEVCLHCYTSVALSSATEDAAEPLLTELGLISSSGNGLYHLNRGPQPSLPNEVFIYALLDFWRRREALGYTQSTLSFNMIAYEYGSPGRVFQLSEDSVSERLSNIAELTKGYLAWTDTAGVRQVSRIGNKNIEQAMNHILRSAYGK
jgi:Protein of unknown function (DUF4007)